MTIGENYARYETSTDMRSELPRRGQHRATVIGVDIQIEIELELERDTHR